MTTLCMDRYHLASDCTDVIHYIIKKNSFPGLYNYINDLMYVGLPSQ